MRRTAATLLLVFAVAGCSSPVSGAPAPAKLTQAQQDDAFWSTYQQRLGMVGRDYANATEARTAAIGFARTVCAEFDKGIDRDVAISQITGRYATAAEAKVQIDTAIEFYCPQHA